jgi:hypothetical protein
MKRESFIKKWLGNKNFQYCEEHKELMREDLDSVLNQQTSKKQTCGFCVELNGNKKQIDKKEMTVAQLLKHDFKLKGSLFLYDSNGNRIYFENSNGYIIDNRPKASCDGKVVEIEGKKYKLTEI